MTKTEQRIRNATRLIIAALQGADFEPSAPESDDTRIEYGGGDFFTVEIDGRQFSVTVTLSYLTDEEYAEIEEAGV